MVLMGDTLITANPHRNLQWQRKDEYSLQVYFFFASGGAILIEPKLVSPSVPALSSTATGFS